jgi:predicted nuclease with TOPRIM domain
MNDKVVPFQYDMFETAQERLHRLRLEQSELTVKTTKASLDKVRKKTFARIDELNRQVEDLSIRLEIIERNICRGSHGPL